MFPASTALVASFTTLLIVTCCAALFLLRRACTEPGPLKFPAVAVIFGVWILFAGVLAAAGVTARWALRPPPAMILAFFGFGMTAYLTAGRLGTQLVGGITTTSLIAFQSFRLPLEIIMHQAAVEGVMPVQMSFEGLNFDILTGILGALLGGTYLLRGRPVPRPLAWAFNILGLGLLINIVGVAVASMPIFAVFGPDKINTWVGDFPFVWLPTVFVVFAFGSHILMTRQLLSPAATEPQA